MSELTLVKRAVGESPPGSEAQAGARAVFDNWFTEDRLLELLESLHVQATNGDVQAAFGLIHLKVGKPSSMAGSGAGSPARDVRASLHNIVEQAREARRVAGQPDASYDSLLAEGIWLDDASDTDAESRVREI